MCDGSCRSGHFCGGCGVEYPKRTGSGKYPKVCKDCKQRKRTARFAANVVGKTKPVHFAMCRYCDKWFARRDYESKKRFCSPKCWEDAKANFSKDECKRWKYAMYTFKRSRANHCVETLRSDTPPKMCEFCGSVFIPDRTRSKDEQRFCDIECACNWKSIHYRNPESNHQKRHAAESEQFRAEREKLALRSNARRWKSCGWCWNMFKGPSICCSVECKKKLNAARVKKRLVDKNLENVKECPFCGKFFKSKHGGRTFCSPRCMRKHTQHRRKHRIRSNGPYDEIGLMVLAKKYGMKCQCCGVTCVEATGKNLDNEMTCDHLIPLSKGGTHTWANVRLLCRRCNSIKVDRVISYENLLNEIRLQVS